MQSDRQYGAVWKSSSDKLKTYSGRILRAVLKKQILHQYSFCGTTLPVRKFEDTVKLNLCLWKGELKQHSTVNQCAKDNRRWLCGKEIASFGSVFVYLASLYSSKQQTRYSRLLVGLLGLRRTSENILKFSLFHGEAQKFPASANLDLVVTHKFWDAWGSAHSLRIASLLSLLSMIDTFNT